MSTTKRNAALRGGRQRESAARGRRAEAPSDLPAPGWRDILLRTKQEIAKDNLSIVAAGVAFYGFMASVPMLGAIVSTYALVADPAQASEHLQALAQVVPAEAMPLLREQMQRLMAADHTAGIGAVVGLFLAVYASAKATHALITGLNIAYDEEERRGFVRLQLVALTLTFGAVLAAVLALALVAVFPAVAEPLGLSEATGAMMNWVRWPLLVGGFVLGLAVLYRFGPSRNPPQWRWLSAGALVATGLWIAASLGFSLYVRTLGNYEKTYGSLGALVVFLLWLYLTGYVVLLGAELNTEMERQTEKDTTEGEPKPLGQRAAYSADTVGPSPD